MSANVFVIGPYRFFDTDYDEVYDPAKESVYKDKHLVSPKEVKQFLESLNIRPLSCRPDTYSLVNALHAFTARMYDLTKRVTNPNLATVLPKSFDVLVVGESHSNLEIKMRITQSLSNLKKENVAFLGLEVFQSQTQHLLDRYFKTGEGLDDIKSYLHKAYPFKDDIGIIVGLIDLITTAREQGIRIIALDKPKNLIKNQDDGDQWINERNKWMADRVKETLKKNPGKKIVCLVGNYHVPGIYRDLHDKGLKSHRIVSQGGVDPYREDGVTIFDDALSWKAHQKGIGGEEFILADPVSGASLYYFPLYSPRPCFADFGRKICRP